MATFKVGQRVRVIGTPRHPDRMKNIAAFGREATVVAIEPREFCGTGSKADYGIEVDGFPCPGPYGTWWGCRSFDIAPLLDPGADEFLADIERGIPQREIA